MAQVFDLGSLVRPEVDLDFAVSESSDGTAPLSDKDVASKAVEDAKEVPSIWFVNFPTKAAAAQEKMLGDYMQNVQDYRSWASLIWWRTVYGNAKVPQDSSKASIAARSAFAAKVGVKHMRTTPWLAMNVDHDVHREIECKTSQFHTQLLEAVLQGFVGVVPAVLQALEGILQSLAKTIEQSASNSDTKTIVCERYEYIPEAKMIRSYVRLISFKVTDSMRNVKKAKSSEQIVKCSIDYNEYEATFNQKLWGQTAANINDAQKKAAEDFTKQQTVDCEP